MPFGIHSAQEVFHKRLHELFHDLDGVETDIDDILVWGRTVEEHDERLEKTLQRARQSNLKLNPGKCKIRCTEVLHIGHVLTGDGFKPDASKLEAILEMPAPEDKHGVQRLLEMVNYSTWRSFHLLFQRSRHPYVSCSRKLWRGIGLSAMNSHFTISSAC